MKTKNAARTAILTLVFAASLGGAGGVTSASAAPRVAGVPDLGEVFAAGVAPRKAGKLPKHRGAFEPGAAERKAAKLPKAWRMRSKIISFDSMYAR